MGYERNDRDDYRYSGSDRGRGRDRYEDPNDRGFFDRAGDELRSWFGDEEAERRRRMDERYDERADRGARSRYATYAPGGYSGPDYPRFERANRDDGRRAGGGYARNRAPYSTYYPSAGEDRQFADQPRDTGFGMGDYGNGGYNYNEDRSRRDAEYRALYSRGQADRGNAYQDDPHGYHSWRSRQIDSFDRDYDEYRRENQSRFESEFSAWRQNRQTQRDSLRTAKEQQEVVGSDGQHVGKVDHVRGDQILLAKSDKDAGGHHHTIPSSWINRVDDKVHLSKTADEAKRAWRDADERGGLFGGDRQQEDGGTTNLNRSFSGTY